VERIQGARQLLPMARRKRKTRRRRKGLLGRRKKQRKTVNEGRGGTGRA
jgi:hypothetical protein